MLVKDSVSVHTVERGNMPLRAGATGSVVSLQPPRALVTLSERGAAPCQAGQIVSAQLSQPDSPRPISGKVINASGGKCEVEFSQPLPASTRVGQELDALLVVSELRDVLYFARPGDAKANSEAFVFVVEPGDGFARRAAVRYGELSGPMIQIVSGLSPGDRVIVTDMSKWVTNTRIRLQ